MEFFLNDPTVPRLPPEQTRLTGLRAEPYPDGQRLRVILDLTPFQQRPYLELTLTDPAGAQVASADIVEPMSWKLELTLHNRKANLADGKYTLVARLSYPELGEIDRRELVIELPAATA